MKKPIPPDHIAKTPPEETEYTFFEAGKDYPFQPDITTFDLCNAWWLAKECSFLSYKDPPCIMQTVEEAGLEQVRCFETGKSFATALPIKESLIVTFRGTISSNVQVIQDIITNVQHALVPAESGGHVHQGFYQAFVGVWEESGLKNYVETYRKNHPAGRIWFTGHSLGGALATMAAVITGENCSLYTFGTPMVGNKQYAKQVPQQSFRIVHRNDVVPHLPPPFPPPESRAMEYSPAGNLRYIDRKGIIRKKVTDRDRPLAAILRETSRIANTLSDTKSSLLYRIYSLGKQEWQEHIPAGEIGEELERIAALLTDYMDASVPDHAPVLYAAHLWNNYMDQR